MKRATAKHYAKALVDIAIEGKCWEQLFTDLADVDQKVNANLEFKIFLENRHVALSKKQEAVKAIFQDFISQRTYNFIYLLIKDDKLKLLGTILKMAKKFNLGQQNLTEVLVESVIPLTAKQEKIMAEKLGRRFPGALVIRNLINPEIIAGLRIKAGDTEIDGSIYGKILRLKMKIEKIGE